jgi:hypothetical protein
MENQLQASIQLEPGEKLRASRDLFIEGYDKEPLLRLLVQLLLPFGSAVDSAIASKAARLHEARVVGLLETVVANLSDLERRSANMEFLNSEEFLEHLETLVRAIARTSNARKRKYITDFLTGTIKRGRMTDLSQQIAQDVGELQDLHLQVLKVLPAKAGSVIDWRSVKHEVVFDWGILNKAIADLVRFGFVHHGSEGTVWGDGDLTISRTTQYLAVFKKSVLHRQKT